MENNVRQVKASSALKSAAEDLAGRALMTWKVIDASRSLLKRPMERTGRKAQPMIRPGEVMA